MMIALISNFQIWLVLWIVLVVSIILSGLYSAMEIGIYVTNKIRLELQAESGSAPAQRLRNLLKNPNNLLVSLLVGVNIANYAAAFAISSMFILAGVEDVEWYTMAVATPIMFILGESIPKNVSQRLGERLMYPLTSFLWLSVVVLNAVGLSVMVRGFAWLTRRLFRVRQHGLPLGHEGFSAIIAEGQASGVLSHFQSIMADRIMHMQEVSLRDVMIPMPKVVSAPHDVTREQLLELLRQHEYSRLPVVDDSGNVVGVLDIYDITSNSPDTPPQSMMTEPLILDMKLPINNALYQMQQSRKMMAIVAGAGGKHVGIATIKDIVEEIVGELEAW